VFNLAMLIAINGEDKSEMVDRIPKKEPLEIEIAALRAENKELHNRLQASAPYDDNAFINFWQLQLQGKPNSDLITQAFTAMCERLDCDLAHVHFYDDEKKSFSARIGYPAIRNSLQTINDYSVREYPWSISQLMKGKTVIHSDLNDMPAEAAQDQKVYRSLNLRANMNVPIIVNRRLYAVVSVGVYSLPRQWLDSDIQLLRRSAKLLYRVLSEDLTAYKKTRIAELLDSVVQLSEIGYWVWEQRNEFTTTGGDLSNIEEGNTPGLLNAFAALHPDDRASAEKQFAACRNRSINSEGRYRSRDVSGNWRWYRLKLKALASDENGRASRVVGVFSDITSFIEQQQLLEDARDKADQANSAKSNFLARMSHEIRTPMNAIIGMSYLMSDTGLTQRQHEYLDSISVSANDLLKIINDILDFSKIEEGRIEVDIHEFDLDTILDQIACMFDVHNADNNLEVIFDAEKNVPNRLLGDGERVKQVLINLMTNAVKFTEAGNVILQVKLQQARDEEVILDFSVSDSGIGLTDEQQSALFQPFVQGDESTTRRYGGTGLGLSISKGLVEMMGGRISVSSEYGEGTVFSFHLPFSLGAKERNLSAITATDLQKMHALVVDDNKEARDAMSRSVSSLGLLTDSTDSGSSAIDMVLNTPQNSKQKYDVIFMDYRMPEMDGITAAGLIKSKVGENSVPLVIMVTASDYSVLKNDTLKSVDAFLNKPVSRSRIFDTLVGLYAKEISVSDEKIAVTADDRILNGIKVLLVEDNVVNQKVAVGMLGRKGLSVDVVFNGAEALEMLNKKASGDYDLILMDMEMPVMDGVTATKEIRCLPEWQGIPILAMTANAIKGDRERCLEAGMNGYISKPISPRVLFDELVAALKN
jgi:signal transduction histidine kinase/DNA-binding response OmpR family regulator